MRNLVRTWSICLIAAGTAACSASAGNNSAGEGNAAANVEAEADAGNEAAPPPGNEAAPPADGNAAAEAAAAYRASGSEPFWSLTVTDAQMVYNSADGPDVTVATPPRQPTRAGYRYVTPEMTVAVNTVQRCDAANGEEYHDTVRVTIGAATVTGCGGEVTAAAE